MFLNTKITNVDKVSLGLNDFIVFNLIRPDLDTSLIISSLVNDTSASELSG
ncbi:MAG: hypothetical protein AB1765_08740 [Candidatus Hydrogenedentota bacterium]